MAIKITDQLPANKTPLSAHEAKEMIRQLIVKLHPHQIGVVMISPSDPKKPDGLVDLHVQSNTSPPEAAVDLFECTIESIITQESLDTAGEQKNPAEPKPS